MDSLHTQSPQGFSTLKRLVSGRILRCGYTTGTCAAAAAKAATTMLINQCVVDSVHIETPDGTAWQLEVVEPFFDEDQACCAIVKDAGDDPDATDGALIYATVSRQPTGISIDGGEGIGRVTKAGLDQGVGEAAINSVPRRMIEEAVREIAGLGDALGFKVVISCPTGKEIAAKTFNPRLGVIGGISILGTTGIVEPMSNSALVETLAREVSILAATGVRELLVVLGNYGESFVRGTLGLNVDGEVPQRRFGVVKSSNFIGDAINASVEHGFESVLIVGHVGKLVKVGIGMLNTHSSMGDGRMETLVACALEAGATAELLRQVLDCTSTDAALSLLADNDLMSDTVDVLARRIQATFDRQVPDSVTIEWVCFMRMLGSFTALAQSTGASKLIERWRQ